MTEIEKLKQDRKDLEKGVSLLIMEFCEKNPEMDVRSMKVKTEYLIHVKKSTHILTNVDVIAEITVL